MKTALRGQLSENVKLAKYTSWRVGGAAKRFYKPADVDDLSVFLSSLTEKEQIFWLGLGSNVLIRDAGINGTVIFTLGSLKNLEIDVKTRSVRAEAGITCAKMSKFCARNGLSGGTFFAGIPGTIGGALAMNAGAFGGITWEKVVKVETIDRCGKIRIRSPEDFKISYREVKGPSGEWFTAGHFLFQEGDPKELDEEIHVLLRKRSNAQPIGTLSCGSVFRNPTGDFAARLIELTGLKGMRIGGAWVSEKHANFILNGGDATASDIEQLIKYVAEQVENKQKVRLIPEVHIIGEPL